MFRFADSNYLNLIPVLVFIFFFFLLVERRNQKRLKRNFKNGIGAFLTKSLSLQKRYFKLSMKFLCLLFLILALARPQMGTSTQKIKSEGVEMVILFDVSTSMLSEDVKPSRISYAKSQMIKLLDLMGGDKVGLVAFAASAVLISPITNDKEALKMYIESLSTQSVENQGTEFKKALLEAESAFDRGGIDSDEHAHVTRVILIASDGEDQESGALEVAKRLSQKGIKIFSLAFGSEHGGNIPIRDEHGNLVSTKRDRTGKEIITTVNDKALRDLAEAGGGSFYHSSFGGNEMKFLQDDFNKLEKSLFDSESIANYDEKFQYFLILSVLFAFIDLLVGERKSQSIIWPGRFEVGKTK